MIDIFIDYDTFKDAVYTVLKKNLDKKHNPGQADTVSAPKTDFLFVVAGPGTGKTTAMTLRVLRLMLVDNIDPSAILVTTFTRKAATELRSRILGWGDKLRNFLVKNEKDQTKAKKLKDLDLNRVLTGTLDSVCEDVLMDSRLPGSEESVVIQDLAANTLMIQQGIVNRRRQHDPNLQSYVKRLVEDDRNKSPSDLSKTIRSIGERIYHDQADFDQYRNSNRDPAIHTLCRALDHYDDELKDRRLQDFARLEQLFLDWLHSPNSSRFKESIQFLLVDEYQDTNLLQERIYFELAKSVKDKGGSVTVVGDDDQSIFRFRGATVDLFQDFQTRFNGTIGISPTKIDLTVNYRSSVEIVEHCNSFIRLDAGYQSARVGNKQKLTPNRNRGPPILAMFRDDLETLANDLTDFIDNAVRGNGVTITDKKGNKFNIKIDQKNGKPSDIAFLVSSPNELNATRNPRLPLLLRRRLGNLANPIRVFNPRGRQLYDVDSVMILCGLMLECIDPNDTVIQNMNISDSVIDTFDTWRNRARAYIRSNPPSRVRIDLGSFVSAWQTRSPTGKRGWDREVPLTDLVYKLVTWIPSMHNDIEGLVYLSGIVTSIEQAGLIGNFGSKLVFDQQTPSIETASIKEIVRNVFEPIASGLAEIDEDLLETLPDDRFNIMSIHQSKGLEFPLVIVDVGSDYKVNHPKQRIKRFPDTGGTTCNIEDEVRPYSPLGVHSRGRIERAFDDLTRLYFEAYSRPQDALLVVGLTTMTRQSTNIKSVALGWDRAGTWHWRGLNNLVLL